MIDMEVFVVNEDRKLHCGVLDIETHDGDGDCWEITCSSPVCGEGVQLEVYHNQQYHDDQACLSMYEIQPYGNPIGE